MHKKQNLHSKFKRVTLRHRDVIRTITKQLPPYCDFNFSNLYNWSFPSTPTAFFIHNNNLVIKMRDFTSNREIVSVCGISETYETIKHLLNEFDELRMIPEETVSPELHNDMNFIIEEDRGNFDYIFLLEAIANLRGNKYKSKRQLVTKFERRYKDELSVKILDTNKVKTVRDILKLVRSWGVAKRINKEDLLFELNAIKRSLHLSKHLNILVIGLFYKNELIAFTINELLDSDTAMGSFGKSDLKFKGATAYIEKITAGELLKRGYVYINFEQDLDFDGLRRSKISWRHIKFLKKYKVRRINK